MVSKLAGNSLTRAKKTCFYDKKNSSKCEDPFCVMAFTFFATTKQENKHVGIDEWNCKQTAEIWN